MRAVNDVTHRHQAPARRSAWSANPAAGSPPLGRLVLRLDEPTGGEIRFEGVDLAGLDRDEMIAVRKKMQVIFQDPYSSLNPRMTVGQIIAEPIRVHGILPKAQISDRVAELLQVVGLFPYMALRYPHELSGGQRQRVGIASALAVNPRVIVCDEAVSALDVSIQGQVINLLEDLQQKLGLTYLFIAHDLAVVRHISNKRRRHVSRPHRRVRAGRRAVRQPQASLYAGAARRLPVPDPVSSARAPRTIIKGEVPSPLNPPSGCVFHPRCPLATEECRQGRSGIAGACAGALGCLHSR